MKINNKLVFSQFIKDICVFFELIPPLSFFIDIILLVVFFEKFIQVDSASSRMRRLQFFNKFIIGLDLDFFCEFGVWKLRLLTKKVPALVFCYWSWTNKGFSAIGYPLSYERRKYFLLLWAHLGEINHPRFLLVLLSNQMLHQSMFSIVSLSRFLNFSNCSVNKNIISLFCFKAIPSRILNLFKNSSIFCFLDFSFSWAFWLF